MRRIRSLLIALTFALGFSIGAVAPADAVWCPDESRCDCSVRIKEKVIIPCNY